MGVIGLRVGVDVTASVEVETILSRVGVGAGVNVRLLRGSKEAVRVEPVSVKGVLVVGAMLVFDPVGAGGDCDFILELQPTTKRRRKRVKRVDLGGRIIPSSHKRPVFSWIGYVAIFFL